MAETDRPAAAMAASVLLAFPMDSSSVRTREALAGRDPGPSPSRGPAHRRPSSSRRASFLAGRRAAHAALVQWLPPDRLSRVDVVRGALGQPTALVDGAVVAEVSLAHSDGWACAVASAPDRPFGIDLEVRSSATAAMVRRGLREEFTAFTSLPAVEADDAALCLWTAREAVAKTLKTGLAVGPEVLAVDAVRPRGDGLLDVRFSALPLLRCTTMVLDEVVLSWSTFLRGDEPLEATTIMGRGRRDPRSATVRRWWLERGRVGPQPSTFVSGA